MDDNTNKGLMHSIFHGAGSVVTFDPSTPFKLEDMDELMNNLRKQDEDRRERLDKEYTPIGDIKLKDLEEQIGKYGNDIPNGLFVKVNWYGKYIDFPAAGLLHFFREMRKQAERLFENQNNNQQKNEKEGV